jgi:hypothetical protein
MTKMSETVLIIDDSSAPIRVQCPDIQVEALPFSASSPLSEIRDWIAARHRDGRLHAGEDDRAVDVIGLNANLVIQGSRGSGRRTDANGVRLVEWLRKDLRLTTAVVLWSFLDFDCLRAKHPILTLSKGLVFVRVPASLTEFREAFQRALAPENALSPELLHQELARLYPGESRATPVPAEMVGKIGALAPCYEKLDGQVTAALDELASGSAEALLALLGGDDWQVFEGAVEEVERQLRRQGTRVRELEEAGTRATALSSFAQWHSGTQRSPQELTEAAPYYRDCAVILRNSMAALASPVGGEAAR